MLDESFRIEQLAENTVSNQQMEILNQMNSVISRPNGRRRTSSCMADEFDDASRSSSVGASGFNWYKEGEHSREL